MQKEILKQKLQEIQECSTKIDELEKELCKEFKESNYKIQHMKSIICGIMNSDIKDVNQAIEELENYGFTFENCDINSEELIADNKLYAVWAESENIAPLLIGIAKSPKAVLSMTDLASKEFDCFEYSYSAYTPNSISIDDIVHTFDNNGVKKGTKDFCHTEPTIINEDKEYE